MTAKTEALARQLADLVRRMDIGDIRNAHLDARELRYVARQLDSMQRIARELDLELLSVETARILRGDAA